MKTIRTRIEGDEIVVPLAEADDNLVKVDQIYHVVYGKQGEITLIPKIEDPFAEHEVGALYEPDIWADAKDVGREMLEDE